MNFREWARVTHKALKERPVEERQRDFTAAEVETVMRASIETLVDALVEGDDLYVRSLGRLYVKERLARRVVSNLSSEDRVIHIGNRKAVELTSSALMQKRLRTIQ